MTPYPTAAWLPRPASPPPNLAVDDTGSSPVSKWGPANNTRWPHSTGRGNPATTSCRPRNPFPAGQEIPSVP